MCGLAGFVDPDGRISEPQPALAAMIGRLRHRGPDGEGLWSGAGGVHFAHRRLAIIDTSAAAAQPMIGESGAALIFNGEIYNYIELRSELEAEGRVFRTCSDTEVLLAAWDRWGADCLDRLVGMFAFALWDPGSRRLFLARDRLGKKPLYYHHAGRFFAFASEPKALLALEPICRGAELDPQSLSDFLSLGYILSPKTIYANISRVPAAHWAEFKPESGTFRATPYWRLDQIARDEPIRYDAHARERFKELLDDSVRMRLRADVPVACFLSGGIDSSAIAATAARIATKPPQAFTAGFREESFDERKHAARVARHLHIPHHEIEADSGRGTTLDRVVRYFDEPFADTSLLPMFLLCEATARRVKVALSGDGADEILGGYPTYVADRLYRFYARIPAPIQAGLEWLAQRGLRPSHRKLSFDYRLRRFLGSRGLSPERAHAWWRIVFPDADKLQMLLPEFLAELGDYDPRETFDRYFADVPDADFLTRTLYVDIKTWLADDILVKVDRMSMAHGLEVRSPFLDHRLVEFAIRLESAAKLSGGRGKMILRDVMRPHLPAATLRRRKEGFGAPTCAVGDSMPPALDMPRVFRQDCALDSSREDTTYKSFAFGMLAAWRRHDRELKREKQ